MNRIVFVEDDAEVGSLIAAYLAKHDIDVIVERVVTGRRILSSPLSPIWFYWILCFQVKMA